MLLLFWLLFLAYSWEGHATLMAVAHVQMCVCVGVCMYACVRACVRACVHACMRACVRACMRACVCIYLGIRLCALLSIPTCVLGTGGVILSRVRNMSMAWTRPSSSIQRSGRCQATVSASWIEW